MIEKIEHIDLLALSPYDIDEMVMHFYHQKEEIDIKKTYFYLDFAGSDVANKEITQEEFEENRNDSQYISTLNYKDFEAKFNLQIWCEEFWSFVSEHYIFSKFNQSLKEIITTSTDIQIKILFKDLIQALDFSNKFLEEFQGNSVQRMVADELLKFNEKLYQELHKNYSDILPECFKEKSKSVISKVGENTPYKSNIFRNQEAENWFNEKLEEFGVSNGNRGFGAVIAAIFRDNDCKKHILKVNLTQKAYIEYLNERFNKRMNSTNLSNSDNYANEIEKHIKLYIESLSE